MKRIQPITKNGFTIVELLMVIIIIAIIAGISVVSYGAVQRSARETAARAELESAFDSLAAWKTLHQGVAASSLEAAGLSQPENAILTYWPYYDNSSQFCLSSATKDNSVSYYKFSYQSSAAEEGRCDDIGWVAGEPLAYNETPGTSVDLPTPITGTPDITLYSVFNVTNADAAWSSFGGLNPSTSTNRFYLQANDIGVTSASYRIDTDAQSNLTSWQSDVRLPGYHVAWLQTTDDGTIRSFAYDHPEPTSTLAITPHGGWNFTQLYVPGSYPSYSGVATVVYTEAHDEATRTKVMNWLATKFKTGVKYLYITIN